MKQTEIDYWITSMLESYDNVSDLNITVGKHCRWNLLAFSCPWR